MNPTDFYLKLWSREVKSARDYLSRFPLEELKKNPLEHKKYLEAQYEY